MATYMAYNPDGTYNNIIEIEPAQIAEYEAITGLTLALPPDPGPSQTPDPAAMEAALNLLGVKTRDE